MGKWLRRMGRSESGVRALVPLSQRLLQAALRRRREVTLDIDATVIASARREARYTCQKERGYLPIVGTLHVSGMGVSGPGGQKFRNGAKRARTDSVYRQDGYPMLKFCLSPFPPIQNLHKISKSGRVPLSG